MISMWSRHSQRRVPIQRSAMAFARGVGLGADDADVGVGEHRVEGGGELGIAVADQEPKLGGVVAEVYQQVAGLLGHPSTRPGSAVGSVGGLGVAAGRSSAVNELGVPAQQGSGDTSRGRRSWVGSSSPRAEDRSVDPCHRDAGVVSGERRTRDGA